MSELFGQANLCELDTAMRELDTEAVPPIGGVDFLRDGVGTSRWCRKVFEIVIVQKPLRVCSGDKSVK